MSQLPLTPQIADRMRSHHTRSDADADDAYIAMAHQARVVMAERIQAGIDAVVARCLARHTGGIPAAGHKPPVVCSRCREYLNGLTTAYKIITPTEG